MNIDGSVVKRKILSSALEAKARNEAEIDRLTDRVSLFDYKSMTRCTGHGVVWT